MRYLKSISTDVFDLDILFACLVTSGSYGEQERPDGALPVGRVPVPPPALPPAHRLHSAVLPGRRGLFAVVWLALGCPGYRADLLSGRAAEPALHQHRVFAPALRSGLGNNSHSFLDILHDIVRSHWSGLSHSDVSVRCDDIVHNDKNHRHRPPAPALRLRRLQVRCFPLACVDRFARIAAASLIAVHYYYYYYYHYYYYYYHYYYYCWSSGTSWFRRWWRGSAWARPSASARPVWWTAPWCPCTARYAYIPLQYLNCNMDML